MSKIPWHIDSFFFYLEHLELCTCSPEWWNLLTRILKHSPRLRVLKFKSVSKHFVNYNEPMDCLNEPSSIPECVEIFEWRQYKGTKLEEEVAKYILANAVNLKMVTFSSKSIEKHQMFKKLEFVSMCSKECQLVFE
ncbi:hypothetical protein AALP_AA4G049400 [Arabis alpina]|uniref:FBD domain-containing protein n=1 Tax=Arabis alpina TaxID=50452 RepID=A0A087H182_ARAAL|nr:hypothetical protein AALP_AA4G049400 [Arabis alpina]